MCLYENNHKLFFNDMLVKNLCSIQNVFQYNNDQFIDEITSCFNKSKYIYFHKTQICYRSSLKERVRTYFSY